MIGTETKVARHQREERLLPLPAQRMSILKAEIDIPKLREWGGLLAGRACRLGWQETLGCAEVGERAAVILSLAKDVESWGVDGTNRQVHG
jgi:hypothetical protein